MLCITDEGEGQSVKTEAGIRRVPIHSELIRLGFLDYVRKTKESGHAQLWPGLALRETKPGSYFSAWFGRFRKTLDPVPPDFHSLRHTVRTSLRVAGVDKSLRDNIIGHEPGGEGARYEHATDAELKAAIEYPALNLQRVYQPR